MSKNFKSTKQPAGGKRKTLEDWRTKRLHEFQLPSGLFVKARDIDMTQELIDGKMSEGVLELIKEASKNNTDIDMEKTGLEVIKKHGPEFVQMVDAIVSLALVEPPIGTIADNDHITMDELSLSDKMAIMSSVVPQANQLKV